MKIVMLMFVLLMSCSTGAENEVTNEQKEQLVKVSFDFKVSMKAFKGLVYNSKKQLVTAKGSTTFSHDVGYEFDMIIDTDVLFIIKPDATLSGNSAFGTVFFYIDNELIKSVYIAKEEQFIFNNATKEFKKI